MTAPVSNTVIMRLKFPSQSGKLSEVIACINQAGGHVGAIDIIRAEKNNVVRDINIGTSSPEHAETIREMLEQLDDVSVVHVSDRTFLIHLGGKIEVKSKTPITNRDELSMAYTPGVARVCMAIHADPEVAHNLTIKRNTVAIVTDGTAVLGLGDIGPLAALPVMEGKAMLLKDFADINGFPICLATKDTEEVIKAVKYIAPSFGAINLEDIAAPRCFEIEKRLKAELDIPVFHDDQHGTAIVLTAAFINALKLFPRDLATMKVVVNGVGAAGTACTHMLLNYGVKNIIGFDRTGALHRGRDDLNDAKRDYAAITNPHQETGTLQEVLKGADVFIGLSSPDILTVEDLKNMNANPFIFAMANPTPEIMPELAAPYVAIMATGRSDYPNQINNVLAFPGVFKGVLDCHASDINEEMKLAAATAIASVIPTESLSPDYIIPSVFDQRVVKVVTDAVMDAARKSGVARKKTEPA
jgi:malate dehydrogenase (oxaloacetate-decarboxylating)